MNLLSTPIIAHLGKIIALCQYGDLIEAEAMDVFNYAQTNPGFPHGVDGRSVVSESQFESYRMLGSHVLQQICRKEVWSDRWKKEVETGNQAPLELFHAFVKTYQEPTTDQVFKGNASPNGAETPAPETLAVARREKHTHASP